MIEKEVIKRILVRLLEVKKLSDKWQTAMNEYCKVVAPSSYSPIVEDSFVSSFIEGVCLVYPQMKGDLEYFVYDIPSFKDPKDSVVKYKGKRYPCDVNGYTDFLFDYYNDEQPGEVD